MLIEAADRGLGDHVGHIGDVAPAHLDQAFRGLVAGNPGLRQDHRLAVIGGDETSRPEQIGLTQPALALSAPDVAGVDGDGLLTMEEVLGLRLDADWVVLSACNTGTGAGAGAEAASGLGRAFFYAGTRALLVTNWSVHSNPPVNSQPTCSAGKRQMPGSRAVRHCGRP